MLFFYFNYMHNIINDKSLVLGLMSGTSMDGLDISCARYYKQTKTWCYDLIAVETFSYNEKIKLDLFKTFNKVYNIDKMDAQFGSVLADYIIFFLKKYNLKVDLISSHGHTIFHDPINGYTKQIGLGSVIAEKTGVPVVSNFRQQDIDFGGQGAPLVPVGDQLLFGSYDACVNLGGIANLSFDLNGDRLAFDISPCNMILNFISSKLGQHFDQDGCLAKGGQINLNLLHKLNKIKYYEFNFPKSLGKEYVDEIFISLINQSMMTEQDLLSTCVEHIAIQLSRVFCNFNIKKVLFTGGGVWNKYLMSRISHHAKIDIVIPDDDIVNFKEAIVFGFLGVLRVLNQNNCLSSSTGAYKNHSSGNIDL